MTVSRKTLFTVAATALAVGVAAFALTARAQPAPAERIIGYAVYAHSQYVLVQRADGSLRSCSQSRQTVLRQNPPWVCNSLGALPPA
jgi:hypothetical protein